jgi:hypothetical protein
MDARSVFLSSGSPVSSKRAPRERRKYELIGDGTLIQWPAVDEDIDVPNLLRP